MADRTPDANSTRTEAGSRAVVVIGSGPAGLTAALYAARADLRPLVIAGEPSSTSDQPGGQLMLTTEVENFPGFPEGVMGPDLMERIRAQAERFGAEIITAKVSRVDFGSRPFSVWTSGAAASEPAYRTRSIIVAAGAQALRLGVPGETELLGHGVSTCATCDGFFFRDKSIAVVGGGDSALEEAAFLSRFAESVVIIHRRKELRASKIMQDRAFSNPKISFVFDAVVTAILGDNHVTGLRLRDVASGESRELQVDACFVAIGHAPNTELFRGQLEMDPAGYIRTHEGTRTNVPGVFACGDVQDHEYRQAITAAGSGCMAALDADRYLTAVEGG
ncbi:MAG TPA: thioredoxin-disulfide reductase [Acidimicrobiales bacterium]|nr:thioredoxin-disulfide reductase [Acidimicrobiales bacterium]